MEGFRGTLGLFERGRVCRSNDIPGVHGLTVASIIPTFIIRILSNVLLSVFFCSAYSVIPLLRSSGNMLVLNVDQCSLM